MKGFEEGVTALQVGVRKSPRSPFGPLGGLPPEPAEAATLATLGTMDLMRRAGVETVAAAPLPASLPESRRVARAAHALAEAFALKAEAAVVEWIDAAAAAGFVAPPAALPDLLGLPKRLRPRLRPVLGARGLWLAERMGIAFDDETSRRDADAARTLLRDEFDTLDYRELVRNLAAIAEEATSEDEPLLMRAFADRRKELRSAGAEGLVRLSDSAPARELRAIAERIVVVHRGLLRRSFEVVPPDPESLPDWLPRATGREYGPAALALLDVVRRVPLSVWEGITGKRPPELLDAAAKSDYADALIEGWQWAALRFGGSVWMDEFFRRSLFKGNGIGSRLLPEVSPAVFDEVMTARLRDTGWRAVGGLRERRERISPALSRAVVEAAKRAGNGPYYEFDHVGTLLDLSVLPLLREPWGDEPGSEHVRDHWRKILDLRRRLLESLR